jgi:hypothetical protein
MCGQVAANGRWIRFLVGTIADTIAIGSGYAGLRRTGPLSGKKAGMGVINICRRILCHSRATEY